MWNVIICDDEQGCRESVAEMLGRYEEESGETFDVMMCESAEELLERYNEKTDLILLDIQMKTLNGMNAARALRQRGSEVQIIFITSMAEYAIEGYEVHAFGFLKKPVHYRQLAWQLDDLLGVLKKKRGVSVVVQDGSVMYSYQSSEIMWIEALGHDVILHLGDGRTTRCNTPLSKLEEQLKDAGFFRVHKSFLINMQYVAAVKVTSIEMQGGDSVLLSKHRRQEFITAFAKFKGMA